MEIAITSIALSAIWATVFYIYKKSVEKAQETMKEANELMVSAKIKSMRIEKDKHEHALKLLCSDDTRITEGERFLITSEWNKIFKAKVEMNNRVLESLKNS